MLLTAHANIFSDLYLNCEMNFSSFEAGMLET